MPNILIIYHTQSGNTEQAAKYVSEGAKENTSAAVRRERPWDWSGSRNEEDPDIEVTVKKAEEAGIQDLFKCDGIAIGTPDYFNYMAGMVKDFFDRTFYPARGEMNDKPCITFVTHGGGAKANESLERICNSFEFKLLQPTVMVKDTPDEKDEKKLKEAGRLLAEACQK